jgi:hypothetical protein
MTSKLEERFWARVRKTPGCWEWTGHKNEGGYGSIRVNGKTRKATHAAIMLRDGTLPEPRTVVCHSCDNPACVRPDHLWIGSLLLNNRDRHAKGRTVIKPSFFKALGERQGLSKLTTEKVLEIRASTKGTRALATQYGVSLSCIEKVRERRTWKHV